MFPVPALLRPINITSRLQRHAAAVYADLPMTGGAFGDNRKLATNERSGAQVVANRGRLGAGRSQRRQQSNRHKRIHPMWIVFAPSCTGVRVFESRLVAANSDAALQVPQAPKSVLRVSVAIEHEREHTNRTISRRRARQ